MLNSLLKRLFGSAPLTGEITLLPDLIMPAGRKGKDLVGEKISHAIASSGAEPGDIVEVDKHGFSRVVGRRPRIVGQDGEMSEYSIRERLRKIYGDDVTYTDVTNGSNVIVFKKHN